MQKSPFSFKYPNKTKDLFFTLKLLFKLDTGNFESTAII